MIKLEIMGKKGIQCPLCNSFARSKDVRNLAVFQVDCRRCGQYRVTYSYWDEFRRDPEIRKISEVLSKGLHDYFQNGGIQAGLSSRKDVENVLRWQRS